MPLSWQDRLDLAKDEADVVGVVREFVAQLSPRDISLLPPECRPGKFLDAGDITSYGFTLMRQACGSSDPTSVIVHRLVAFLSNACVRLAQVVGRSQVSADEAQQSAGERCS